MMMKADDSMTDMNDGPERQRRGAHGPVCVNLFSNRLCNEFVVGGSRMRRKGHGGSQVCQAIVASARMQAQAAILFSEDTVSVFGIEFDGDLNEDQVSFCESEFTDIVGAVQEETNLKGPDRDRRASHHVKCVNIFANQLCAAFVGGNRQRRKGHGASAVCRAIVESAKAKKQMDILFSSQSVSEFDIKFEIENDELAARCDTDFGDLVGASNAAMMMKANDSMTDMNDGPERQRRGAHGPVCVNLFANRLCADFVGGDRQRRKGHGASAVCQAIVASAKANKQMEILFSDETVAKFDIKFEVEDAELGARCDDDFGDLVGAQKAANMMKTDDSMDPERSRRGAHGPACINIFANRLCADFVGGSRQRRKGHGASAVCQAIVASARANKMMQILFSDETVTKFEIAFAEETGEQQELGVRCDVSVLE